MTLYSVHKTQTRGILSFTASSQKMSLHILMEVAVKYV